MKRGRIQNLKPWPKGVSGNPGGRPKTKPLTDVLEWLLDQEAPGARGRTYAEVIAEALIKQARKGDVRAIAELANRIEGKPLQPVNVDASWEISLAEGIKAARERVTRMEAGEVAKAFDEASEDSGPTS